MLVSIIIVNYNSFRILEECLTSIIQFTKNVSFEIIVVDNNSSEGDVTNVTNKFNDIILIKNPSNLGFAAANNQGIKISKGKYILFLNNDTLLIENTIKIITDFADNLGKEVFIGCKLLNKDYSHQESVVEFPSLINTFSESFFLYKIFKKNAVFNKYYMNYLDITKPIEVDIIKGAFMFCSKKAIDKLGGFDERFFFYSEETDLCFRFKEQFAGEVIYYPESSIIHLGGATTQHFEWFNFKNQTIAKIQFYQKHFKGPYYFFTTLIYFAGVLIRIPLYLIFGIVTLNKSTLKKSFYYLLQLTVYPKNKFK